MSATARSEAEPEAAAPRAEPEAAPARKADGQAVRGPACGGALRDDLGWALGVVFRAYVKAANVAFSELPGGPRGYQVLASAARGQPGSQLELARHLGVDRTVMTYLLDDLEKAGLIERRPDPQDRRARQIVATASGRERLGYLDRQMQAAEQHVLAGLDSEADRRAFRALLFQLAAHAHVLDPVHSSCEVVADVGLPCAPGPDAPV
jgi:DNA-binding MarR family transcriptional regulator